MRRSEDLERLLSVRYPEARVTDNAREGGYAEIIFPGVAFLDANRIQTIE